MKRKIITALALALCLAGCGDTVVFLPEDPMVLLAVPAGNTEAPTEAAAETEVPVPAIPEETEAAKIQHSTGAPSSPNKGNAEIGSTVASTTVTKPVETEPKETKPAATEPKETKPAATGPKETKPAPTESVQLRPTQPAPTKPKETEPKETQPPATESVVLQPSNPPESEPKETKPAATEPKETKPPETKPAPTESVQLRPTQPAPTKPRETEPKETQPPATESVVLRPSGPAETVPVSTRPRETEPPATEPPVTEPPATEPPETEPPATESPVTEPPLYDISGYVVGNLEYRILDRINEYRAEEGLEELYLDSYLCAIASCRGYEANLLWSHTRPDGRDFATVLDDYGYGSGSVQELLAYANSDADAVVDKWMGSESHRSILLGTYTTLGVGIYRANGYTFVACLMVE